MRRKWQPEPVKPLDLERVCSTIRLRLGVHGDVIQPVVLAPLPATALQINEEGVLDCWPMSELKERTQALQTRGALGVYWTTRKGTMHTVEQLARAKPEDRALVWLGAWLHDLENAREDWRGSFREALRELCGDCCQAMGERELYWWHHAMREALPERFPFEVLHKAVDDHFIARCVQASVLMSLGAYRFVRVSVAPKLTLVQKEAS